MCDVDFDGYNDFTCEVKRKARKQHRCEECRKFIEKGEFYTHHSSKYDGVLSSHKTCARCDRSADTHSKSERAMGNNGAFYVGQLLEMVGECSREHPEYVANFRKAWKGEELPPYQRPSTILEWARA